ncbi:hypothetical protein D3C83_125460 [compost metagenome]
MTAGQPVDERSHEAVQHVEEKREQPPGHEQRQNGDETGDEDALGIPECGEH